MRILTKIFFIALFLFVTLFLYNMPIIKQEKHKETELMLNKLLELENRMEKIDNKSTNEVKQDNSDLKYILQWTNPKNVPFVYMGAGRQAFLDLKCEYTNCFVTSDRNLLGDVTKFDVIAYAGPEVIRMSNIALTPKNRSPHQKYAFTSIESAQNYPLCSNRLDGFFNWTWTYRLDSDSRWGYMIVRDVHNNIIGPNIDMHWMKLEEMDPVSEELALQLRTKTKAAAWFVSNCRSKSKRGYFVMRLRKALEFYKLDVDIFGLCGQHKCDRSDEECFQLIKRDYYFYLSLENSFSEDYVTEKLLHGLKYNAIPIVYGGANYTRFMPDGIYLNARELGVEALAKIMKHLIDHPEDYKEYFRWKNHYFYYRRAESAETNDYCGFCKLLNNEEMMKNTSIYKNFGAWWNKPEHCFAPK